ncbi:MAG: hypothetical protein OXG56_12660 [Gammaproteobacteria bacterium]|nr:hypothetical protein [Gammaproteobacteria bacterium]
MTFITKKPPPRGRVGQCDGDFEEHLYEAAVMLAVAQWMFDRGANKVCLHPDGQHAKQFDIFEWLMDKGYERICKIGQTRDAGIYSRKHQTLVIEFKPGQGDIVTHLGDCRVVVEAKGGIINTRHSGQKSKLRKHLYEAVGMLLDERTDADRLIAAVPFHQETKRIACRMVGRCRDAGIEIALVSGSGEIQLCTEDAEG